MKRPPQRVRLTIVGPAGDAVASREVDDGWYQAGGHVPPAEQQAARDRMAAAELREWLACTRRPAGGYTITVVDTQPGGPTWATVSIDHRPRP